MYYVAENLEMRREEFARCLADMTGCTIDEGKTEVDLSIQRLFYWGAYCDKYGGTVQVSIDTNLLHKSTSSLCMCVCV